MGLSPTIGALCEEYKDNERYNVAIDATMFIVPALKESCSVDQFKDRLWHNLRGLRRYRPVLSRAVQIYVTVDYGFPLMKRETLHERRRQRENDPSTRALLDSATDCSPSRSSSSSSSPSSPLSSSPESSDDEIGTIGKTIGNGSKLTLSPASAMSTMVTTGVMVVANCARTAQPRVELRNVRYSLEPIFRLALRYMNVDMSTVIFDPDTIGEGEFKCAQFANWRYDRNVVVITNDNDIYLLMLQRLANERKLVLKVDFPRRRLQLTSCFGKMINSAAKRMNAWKVTLWICAIFGNDYVFELNLNREEKNDAFCQLLGIFQLDEKATELTVANFIRAIELMQLVLPDVSTALRQRKRGTSVPDASALHNWLYRHLWNTLYFTELPVAYQWNDRFLTIDIGINARAPKQRLSAEELMDSDLRWDGWLALESAVANGASFR